MPTDSPTAEVRLVELKRWMIALLVKQGMFAAEAEIVALRLLESELMGRPAGGVRWLPLLLSAMDVGDIDPRARMITLVDQPALLVVDGSTGVGQVTLTQALRHAVNKAASCGAATVILRNSRPVGDPISCLAAATSQGFLAGMMHTCKRQLEPFPIGPGEVWAWPSMNGPLETTAVAPSAEHPLADAIAAGLGGSKSSAMKKKLFRDDAEVVCFLTKISAITEVERFQQVSQQAINLFSPPSWIFDDGQWPQTAEFAATAVDELRDLAKTSRTEANWIV